MKLDIVGLSGKSGSGKDYIGNKIFKKYFGYTPFSLAAHLKMNLIAFDDVSYDDVFKHKPENIRRLLQTRGTDDARNTIRDTIWIDVTFAWMRWFNENWGIHKFVLTDVRFTNELISIQSAGGVVYRVCNPSIVNGLSGDSAEHASENDLPFQPDYIFNGTILNRYNPAHNNVAELLHQVNLLNLTETIK